MILDKKSLNAGLTSGIGINKTQVLLLGEHWPLRSGWYGRLLGKEVSDDDYAKFVDLKGLPPKDARRRGAADPSPVPPPEHDRHLEALRLMRDAHAEPIRLRIASEWEIRKYAALQWAIKVAESSLLSQ